MTGGPPQRKNSTEQTHAHAYIVKRGKEHARKQVAKMFEESTIADNIDEYPKFELTELKLGKVLGKGGFGTVSEILGFSVNGVVVPQKQVGIKKGKKGAALAEDEEETELDLSGSAGGTAHHQESRMFIAQHCLRNNSDARYAVKILSPEVVADPGMFLQGMMDMALETRFMSDIVHPNIVKIRAMAQCDPFNETYFLVMDRLYDTLEKRMKETWLKKHKRASSFMGKKLLDRKGDKKDALFEERIVYAFDLAAALNYLHKRQIIYRDLKPENIGFDIRDDIKLFDFGLAKELRDDLKLPGNDKLYNLTGDTGSPRYMAPEVALGKPYNGTCDSYSFALLLWQMLSLQTPYEVYTVKKLKERVWSDMEKRPMVDESWSVSIKLLLKKSWSNDWTNRFTLNQIEEILRKECIRVRDGCSDGLEHQKRRSTFVFRPNKANTRMPGAKPAARKCISSEA